MTWIGHASRGGSGGRVVLLLGAGASVPAGIPDVRGFLRDFVKDIKARDGLEPLLDCYTALERSWTASGAAQALDLERLYELLTWIQGEEIEPPIPLRLAAPFPAHSRQTELLFWELKKYVQLRCLRFGSVEYLAPLAELARGFAPMSILTLNYDTCVETVLDRARVPWSDGFPSKQGVLAPWSQPLLGEVREGTAPTVRLLKLHGSASWYQARPGWMQRAVGRTQHQVGLRLGSARTMTHEAMMVYPTLNKALSEGPFPALLAAAQGVLAHSDLCLAIGYAFADVHIRKLVLAALLSRPELKVVVVNPRPEDVLAVLDQEPETRKVRDRIGVVDDDRDDHGAVARGFIQNSLEGGWLAGRCRDWLGGRPLTGARSTGGHTSTGPRTGRWSLRFPIPGGAASLCRLHAGLAYVHRSTKEIRWLDTATGESRLVSSRFRAPSGLAFDPDSEQLFLVENAYRLKVWPASLPLLPRGGVGRLWVVDEGGHAEPLTGLSARHWLFLASLWMGNRPLDREELWQHLEGALRWPTSVIVEQPGKTLLVTEAKRLLRFDLESSTLSDAVEIPLCSNLGCLFLEHRTSLFLTDAGIFPNGRGRLMWTDLRSSTVQVLAEGWQLLGSVLALPSQILVSVGSRVTFGSVLALDRARPEAKPLRQWIGLDRPSGMVIGNAEDQVLVGTADGIVELRL